MEPTQEQRAIVDAARKREHLKVIAFAGSGKTSTLGMTAADALDGVRTLYVAFNRAIADEAARRFPPHVEPRTAHSLAFRACGHRYKSRLVASLVSLRAPVMDRHARLLFDLADLGERDPGQAFAALMETFNAWLHSDADRPGPEHVPDTVSALAPAKSQAAWRAALARAAHTLWSDITTNDAVPATHDVYLKEFVLSRPRLPYDAILLDEAQDADPTILQLVTSQPCQLIPVGDPHQTIYAWRGAVSALDRIHAPEFPLTASWRFGPDIADVANRVLALKGEQRRVKGMGDGKPADPPTRCVIGRTNAGLVEEAIRHLDRRVAIAVVGGVEQIVSLLLAAFDLWRGQRARHPELAMFRGFTELEELSETAIGQSYRPIVRLVRQHGYRLPDLANRLRYETVDEARAEVVLSTAHKAKGREWDHVRLLGDFPDIADKDREGRIRLVEDEANLLYVAATRARASLDLGPALDVLEGAEALLAPGRNPAPPAA